MNKRLLYIFLFFVPFLNISAQKDKIDAKQRVDSILITKPETYKEINNFL